VGIVQLLINVGCVDDTWRCPNPKDEHCELGVGYIPNAWWVLDRTKDERDEKARWTTYWGDGLELEVGVVVLVKGGWD